MPKNFPKNILISKKILRIGFDPKLHNENQLNFLFDIKNIILNSSLWTNINNSHNWIIIFIPKIMKVDYLERIIICIGL